MFSRRYDLKVRVASFMLNIRGISRSIASTRVHHALFADRMQPFEAYVREISICSHSGWHYHYFVTLVT